MAERGVTLSYETVRLRCGKFGSMYAKRLRSRRADFGDTAFLDEVNLKIDGRYQYLWRAVDQDGEVIDILVQNRRDGRAAKRFFRKILQAMGKLPRRIVTDKLGSYCVVARQCMRGVEHVRDKGANIRAENSHQPTRERERRRRRFRSAGEAQRFLSTFSVISNHFRQGRHLTQAKHHRYLMDRRFAEWRGICACSACLDEG